MVVCQGQGKSEVLSNQNVTVFCKLFEDMILWQPDLICWSIIVSPEKRLGCCGHGYGNSRGWIKTTPKHPVIEPLPVYIREKGLNILKSSFMIENRSARVKRAQHGCIWWHRLGFHWWKGRKCLPLYKHLCTIISERNMYKHLCTIISERNMYKKMVCCQGHSKGSYLSSKYDCFYYVNCLLVGFPQLKPWGSPNIRYEGSLGSCFPIPVHATTNNEKGDLYNASFTMSMMHFTNYV